MTLEMKGGRFQMPHFLLLSATQWRIYAFLLFNFGLSSISVLGSVEYTFNVPQQETQNYSYYEATLTFGV